MRKEMNVPFSAAQAEKNKCRRFADCKVSAFLLLVIMCIAPLGIYAQNQIDGHEYVDLGLESGVLWATCNVGATSAEAYGNYYKWGEATEYSESKESDSSVYDVDDFSGLEEYDAAAANWGGSWRMPTVYEFLELHQSCKWKVEKDRNGESIIVGIGPNGNKIYFPLAGINLGGYSYQRERGYYNISTKFDSAFPYYAFGITATGNELAGFFGKVQIRLTALSVRAVSSGAGNTGKATNSFPANVANSGRMEVPRPQVNLADGHEYVDLGLSVKWATCNVGAARPELCGDFFAWGETSPKTFFVKGNSKTYSVRIGNIGGHEEYDAARALWGKSWRMPSLENFQELLDKCTWKEGNIQGMRGQIVTGPNGNSIFLPYSNMQFENGKYASWAHDGSYAISTEYSGKTSEANILLCDETLTHIRTTERFYQMSIRPVLSSSTEPPDVTTPISYLDEVNSRASAAASQGSIASHSYVDLGLSVKWATCNIGAQSPEESGSFFAWGETSPRKSFKNKKALTDGKNISDLTGNATYDAATANWGGTWRMPTLDECKELIQQCVWVQTELNGQKGYKVIGPNKNHIFIPYTGVYMGKKFFEPCSCSFWISTPKTEILDNTHVYANHMDYSGTYHGTNTCLRYFGRVIRPVSE